MDGIYRLDYKIFGVHSVALAIIVFTIVIYMCLLPLTYKQQKFSKMTMIMNPEIKAIQKKYRGNRSQDAQMAMQEETQAVYKKYGVNPAGSCVFMAIQLLILFPLYRVIYNVPAYITSVKDTFTDLVTGIMATNGYQDTMTAFLNTVKDGNYAYRGVSMDFTDVTTSANSIIDVLYKCTSSNWHLLAEKFPDLSSLVTSTQKAVEGFNNFIGINIVYSPRILIRTSVASHHYGLIVIAILIPLISAVTQLINIRLMPRPVQGDQPGMETQMKMMNYMMPVYSFILVIFLPTGVGLYWIAGAIIRSIQQFIINKRFDKVDMNELIEKNRKKQEAKRRKKGEKEGNEAASVVRNAAKVNAKSAEKPKAKSATQKANAVKSSSSNKGGKKPSSAPSKSYKQGSLASKANRVNDFNNRNSKGAAKPAEAPKEEVAETTETAQKTTRNKKKK